MKISDEALVRKTLEGDDSAFSKLINRHRGVVHGLCYHLVNNFTDAEDLAQEAFIKAYFNLSSLSNPSKFPSWLRQITTNVCRDWLRSQKNNTVALEDISMEQDAISPSPAEVCEAKELREKVAKAITLLSEKNRQAVTLYYLDGCSCNEVADFLDISATTVQSRLYEARKQLKKELMTMVKEDLQNRKLSEDFEEKVRKAIEQAKNAQSQHAYREVVTYCDEALDVLSKLSDSTEHKKMKREVLWLKGDALNKHASREKAIEQYEKALKLAKEVDDKSSQAHFIGEMGRHYSNVGNQEKAVEYYEQALDMFTELGDKAGQARTLYWLGSKHLPGRTLEESISYYQKALDLFVEIGDKKWEATCYAQVNLLKQFGRQIEEESVEKGPFKIVFSGAVCQEFKRTSDTVVYYGLSGTLGTYMRIDIEDKKESKDIINANQFFNASPFRFLPETVKILDSSLSVCDSWSMDVPSGGMEPMKATVTIESDSETVSVPAGEFSNCLKTKIVTSDEPEDCEENRCGEREFIYAPGVGLIKSTSVRRDGAISIAELTNYTVSNGNEDYFPLAVGNKWTYEWADKDDVFPSTDVYEVTEKDNEYYYVSHYYYALKQAKT